MRPLLRLDRLTASYPGQARPALEAADCELHAGEILGIVGESGSGKSTLLKTIVGELPTQSGRMRFRPDSGESIELTTLDSRHRRQLRDAHFGIVHQYPALGLHMAWTAGGNIAERLLQAGERHFGRIRARARSLLQRLEVDPDRMDDLPGTMSGGMQQRVQIAKALACRPRIVLLDEFTSGLDVSVQARLLDLVLELQREDGLSMIVVTHDLGVVRLLAGRTLVMRHGRIVEAGLTDQILEDPQHAYTQQLVASSL